MTQPTDQPVQALAYSTPGVSGRPSPTLAAFALAIIGLILLFFGGCFTIGILMHLHPGFYFNGMNNVVVWTTGDYVLHPVLYLLAFVCFISGAFLIVRGVMGLTRILWGQS